MKKWLTILLRILQYGEALVPPQALRSDKLTRVRLAYVYLLGVRTARFAALYAIGTVIALILIMAGGAGFYIGVLTAPWPMSLKAAVIFAAAGLSLLGALIFLFYANSQVRWLQMAQGDKIVKKVAGKVE